MNTVEQLKYVTDEYLKAFRNINMAEFLFSQGKSFTHSDFSTFADGEVKRYVFDPTAYIPPEGGKKWIVAFIPIFDAAAGPITIEFYAGCTVSDNGTSQFVFNRDGSIATDNKSTLTLNPTELTPGVRFSGMLNPATAVGVNGKGSNVNSELPFGIDITKKYCVKVTNTNGPGVLVGMRFTWFEI